MKRIVLRTVEDRAILAPRAAASVATVARVRGVPPAIGTVLSFPARKEPDRIAPR